MALDRRLSRNFWLHEFTGWQNATEEQVRRLQETVSRVLQPIRSEFGTEVVPTSWIQWSSGAMRTGSHAHGGAVDFVLPNNQTREAFEWGARYLVPAGYIGRWIYEPARSAAEGTRQGEHVHMAPREAMVALGEPDVQVLVEKQEGEYEFFRAGLGLGTAVVAALFFFPCDPGGGGSSVRWRFA